MVGLHRRTLKDTRPTQARSTDVGFPDDQEKTALHGRQSEPLAESTSRRSRVLAVSQLRMERQVQEDEMGHLAPFGTARCSIDKALASLQLAGHT